MSNLKNFAQLTITFVIVGAFIAVIALAVNATGAWDAYRVQTATRRAEAEAARLQAELELTRARADAETAAGERAVLEAASRSVDSDRRLTEYYALRNDVRAILALVAAVGLAICGGVILTVVRGWQDAKNTDHE